MNTEEGSESRAVAVRAFKWILSAYTPLELSELSYAVAIRDDGVLDPEVNNDFVLDVCSNFVTIDTSDHPQFAHASVRDFLEDLEIEDSKVYSARSVHTQAAKTCLIYLTSSMFLCAPERDLDRGFPAYVRRFWARHCEACEDNRKEDIVLQKSFLDILSLENIHLGLLHWHKMGNREYNLDYQDRRTMEDCMSPEPSPFLIACMFGFLDVVDKHRPEDQATLNAQNYSSRSGLCLACKYGHLDTALMLLRKGAPIDERDSYLRTPLGYAVIIGNEALVRTLLEAGADVETKDCFGLSPLLSAVSGGSIPLVRMLLDFHANQNTTWQGKTCLEVAVERHHEDVARLLREAGAKMRSDDPQGLTSSLTRY